MRRATAGTIASRQCDGGQRTVRVGARRIDPEFEHAAGAGKRPRDSALALDLAGIADIDDDDAVVLCGLDGLGRRASFAGMRLLYHNHDFEMVVIDGKPAISWLLEAAKPENVGFEPDLAWIVFGGQDAVGLLQQYSGRVPRVHAKDLGDNAAEHGLADVGSGRLDWDAILPAAEAAQAEWLVVEHDFPTDPLASIQRSQTFLAEKLKA